MSCKPLILLVIIINFYKSYSQGWQYPYINYTIKDGLPSNEVYDVLQDSFGYLWFATDNGLSRYDGYGFKNYGKEKGLTDRVVFDLQLDKNGRIWMSSLTRKMFVYDPKKDTILSLESLNDIISRHTSTKIKYLYTDRTEVLRIDCNNGHILFSIDKNLKLKKYEYFMSNEKLTKNNFPIRKEYCGDFFYNYSFYNNKIKFDKFILSPLFATNYTYNEYLLNDTVLVIVMPTGSVTCMGNKKIFQNKHGKIDDFLILSHGKILVSYGSNGGLVLYKNVNDFASQKGENLLPGISVSGLFLDKQNILWACSNTNGVYKINFDGNSWQFSIDQFNQNSRIRQTIGWKNDQLKIYFKNGDNYILPKKGSFSIIKNTIKNIDIATLYQVKDRLFVRTEASFFGEIKGDRVSFIGNICNENTLPITGGLMYYNTYFGNYFYTTIFSGFYKYDFVQPKCDFIFTKDRITNMLFVNKDLFYVTSVSGLFQFKHNIVEPVARELHPYLSSRIDFIKLLPDSTILLASKNEGLYFFQKNCLDYIDIVKDYKIDLIKIIEVNKDDIWVVTTNSVLILKYRLDKIIDIAILRMGIEIPEDQVNSVIFDKDEVILGMEKNIFILKSQSVFNKSNFSPAPLIESVELNKQAIAFKNNSTFRFNENNFTIKVIGINHRQNGDINYKYAVNGGKFVEIGGNRELNFFKLSPGKYEFKFIAQNESRIWSNPTVLRLEIMPPWWQTWWFYILVAFLLFSASFFYFRQKLKHQKIEFNLKEEVRNLEISALQAQMNPHFIFNSLNSIQKFILSNDKEVASEYLSKFAQLIRLNLRASNNEWINLSDEITLLNLYLDLEKLRFKNKFEHDIRLELDKKLVDQIQIPPMLIQPIVENAILHGIAGINVKGKITLFIQNDDKLKTLKVIVTDNGNGWTNKPESTHQSMGSKITKRRLELISQNEKDNFKLSNMEDKDKNIIGAKAELTIRYKIINSNEP